MHAGHCIKSATFLLLKHNNNNNNNSYNNQTLNIAFILVRSDGTEFDSASCSIGASYPPHLSRHLVTHAHGRNTTHS